VYLLAHPDEANLTVTICNSPLTSRGLNATKVYNQTSYLKEVMTCFDKKQETRKEKIPFTKTLYLLLKRDEIRKIN